jgi:hypothetical protein
VEPYAVFCFGEPPSLKKQGGASLQQLCMEAVSRPLLKRLLEGLAHHWPEDYLVQLPCEQGREGTIVDLRRPTLPIPSGAHQPSLAGTPGEPKRLHSADKRLPPEVEELRLAVLLGGWGAGYAPRSRVQGPQTLHECVLQGRWFLAHVFGNWARVGLGIATSGTRRGRRQDKPQEPTQLERDLENPGKPPPEPPPTPPNTPTWPPRVTPEALVRCLGALEQSREEACANTSTKASFLARATERVVKRAPSQIPLAASKLKYSEVRSAARPRDLTPPQRVVTLQRVVGALPGVRGTETDVVRQARQAPEATPGPRHREVRSAFRPAGTASPPRSVTLQRVVGKPPKAHTNELRGGQRERRDSLESAPGPRCREVRSAFRPPSPPPTQRAVARQQVVGAPLTERATERRTERVTPARDTLLYSGSAHREEVELGTAAGRTGGSRGVGPRGDRKRHASQMTSAATYAAPGMERLALRATEGEGAMLSAMARIAGIKQLGLNPKAAGTASAHWQLWVKICDALNTSKWRDDVAANAGTDLAGYEREKLLLEVATVIAAQELRPKRSKQRPDVTEVQVATLQQFIRSVRNVHQKEHYPPIEMIGLNALKGLWAGLLRRFKLKFGVTAMMPVQKNPFTKGMIEQMLRHLRQDGLQLMRGKVVSKTSRWAASSRAWVAVQSQTAFRKADSLVCGTDEWTVDDLSRASITWIIDGVPLAWPTDEQLRNLKEGDYIIIRAPPSKTDPYCLIWGTRPIYGAFLPHESINMAREVRDLILEHPVPMEKAATTPLFQMDNGEAMKGSFADGMLAKLLSLQGLGATEAAKFSCHSFRIYLACAMRASGATDAEIQALCRWQSLDSLRIYACLGPETYTKIIAKAMRADVRAVRTHSLPVLDVVDADGEPLMDRYAQWQSAPDDPQ